jgi:hypothetical protein
MNFVDPTGLNAQNCIEVRIWGHPETNGEQSGPSREIIFRFCTFDPNAGIGDFSGYTDFSGGGNGQEQFPGQKGRCDSLADLIDKVLDGYQEGATYIKGIIQRISEQVEAPTANGPGSAAWKGHRDQLEGRRNVLKDLLKKWDKNNCGPRPPRAPFILDLSVNQELEKAFNKRQLDLIPRQTRWDSFVDSINDFVKALVTPPARGPLPFPLPFPLPVPIP